MTAPSPFVIVVGAGPSGLLLTLLLAKQGIRVDLLEAEKTLDIRPRATHYAPPAVRELRRAGILDEILENGGFIPNGACWRKLDGEVIAGIAAPQEDRGDPMICLPLNKLSEIIASNISKYSSAKIMYNHKVLSTENADDKACIEVETPTGKKRYEADYIVGCDGANSQVRRSLFAFGDGGFPGFTWENQIVATNTYYPFESHGFAQDSNFIIDPEHWYMAARISTDGLWRVTYGEIGGLTFDELKARQPEKFKKFLPGHPDPGDYRIVNFSPYRVHQRLAKKMRVGRFLLAADAAHLCNPFGGLGLTGGIADVGGLYDCLYGIYSKQADQSILDLYDTVRRSKYNDFVNPVSSQNIRLLFGQSPETALQDNYFLQQCKLAETNPEFANKLQVGTDELIYDFTKHYKK